MKKKREWDWRLFFNANEKLREHGLYPGLMRFVPDRTGKRRFGVRLIAGPEHDTPGKVLAKGDDRWGYYGGEGERHAVQVLLMRTLYRYGERRRCKNEG